MEQNNISPSHAMKQFLRVYQIEPIGRALFDWLRLPLPVIWVCFVFLYFGVLLILHSVIGTPRPANFEDIFRHPSAFFYYPNLIAVTYDFIGNPLVLVLLVFFRSHIPYQVVQLQQSGFIKENPTASRMARLLHLLGTDRRVQTLTVIIFPTLGAALGLVVDVLVFSPQTTPARYAVFLSMLGRYSRLAVFIQLIYVLVILGNYRFDFRLHLNHPDECGGLAPFGKLSIAAYIYLFVFAMMQAIGTLAGGTGFDRALRSTVWAGALIYLWILFPLAIILVFGQFIYGPHRVLQELQRQYLWAASVAWTNYHQQLTSSIAGTAEQSKVPLVNKASFGDNLELLEVWARLNKYVEDMHTWPIPKRTFRTIAVLANPLVPMLLPVVADVMRNFLP